MKPTFLAPKHLLEKKPPHGAPCTRCGLCCMATLCDLAQHLFGNRRGPCPALVDDGDNNYSCGVVIESPNEEYRAAVRLLIDTGLGCDARFNGEKINLDFYKLLSAYDRSHSAEIAAAKTLWGMS